MRRSSVRRSAWRYLAGLVPLFVLSTVALPTGVTQAAVTVQPPTSDPFYAAPANLASYPPGTVLRSRTVTVQIDGELFGVGEDVVPVEQYSAYQLLYRTNSATGQPVANVTTLIVGDGAAPAGGRRLVSLQDAEDSICAESAPSYQMQVGGNGTDIGTEMEEWAAPFLKLGDDLVVPDPEGPDSEWVVAGMAAHAVLDSIRAVEGFAPAELGGAATPVALIGYSGGGFESAAANEMQPAYAPELNIVAATGGGITPANEEALSWVNNSVFAGFIMEAAISIDRAYPAMGLYSLLNAAGQALAEQVSAACSGETAAPYGNIDSYTNDPDALDLPQVQQVITENELGHAVPTAPTFYYNSIDDELVWIKPLDQLVAYDCSQGAHIDYYRAPVGEHVTGETGYTPLMEAYVNARFAGEAVPDTCGQPGDAVPGTGLIPAPTINYAWSPTYIASQLGTG